MRNVNRAYFTYPVAEGLLEAAAIFAAAARDAALGLVVNNSQFQGTPGDPAFRDLQHAPSFRNLQHRLADRIFDWAQVRVVHLRPHPVYEARRTSHRAYELRHEPECLFPSKGLRPDVRSTLAFLQRRL
jgi:hypothetical protein